MALLNQLIQYLLIGFGIFVFVTSFASFKSEKSNEMIDNLTESAAIVVRLAAIGYLLIWLVYLYENFQSEEEYRSTMNRATGPYWFGYWIYPVCCGVFPQLLWVSKVRRTTAMRFAIASLLLFALGISRFVILVTSFHRDYVPARWTTTTDFFFVYDWFVGAAIFSVALALTYFAKFKLMKYV